MKTKFLLLLLSIATLAACTDDNADNNTDSNVVADTIKSGQWKITYFWDDKDETSDFAGYLFTFSENGTVTATRNGQTTNGTWSMGTDDSTPKLFLNLGTAKPLEELNDDWRILKRTDTKIELEDVSGGNGGTDYLTFEKN